MAILTQETAKMDKFDAGILTALQRDARLSWVKLAEQVNLSTSACQRRVEALCEKGVIEGFTLSLNETALGYRVKAFVAVSIDRQDPRLASEFREWVKNHPRVRTCHMVTGSSDYMLEVTEVDLESLGRFLDSELLSLSAVKDASSSIVLGKVKMGNAVVSEGEDVSPSRPAPRQMYSGSA